MSGFLPAPDISRQLQPLLQGLQDLRSGFEVRGQRRRQDQQLDEQSQGLADLLGIDKQQARVFANQPQLLRTLFESGEFPAGGGGGQPLPALDGFQQDQTSFSPEGQIADGQSELPVITFSSGEDVSEVARAKVAGSLKKVQSFQGNIDKIQNARANADSIRNPKIRSQELKRLDQQLDKEQKRFDEFKKGDASTKKRLSQIEQDSVKGAQLENILNRQQQLLDEGVSAETQAGQAGRILTRPFTGLKAKEQELDALGNAAILSFVTTFPKIKSEFEVIQSQAANSRNLKAANQAIIDAKFKQAKIMQEAENIKDQLEEHGLPARDVVKHVESIVEERLRAVNKDFKAEVKATSKVTPEEARAELERRRQQ